MRRFVLIFVVVLSLVATSCLFEPVPPVSIPTLADEFLPGIESLDMHIDGSTPQVLTVNTSRFDYVMRVIWVLHFTDNTVDWNVFGGEATSLTNGVEVLYNGTSMLNGHPINSNEAFGYTSYDVEIHQDDKVPTDNILLCRWTFTKFVPGGLKVNSTTSLQFLVRDNITALSSIVHFEATVEGYRGTEDPDTVTIVNPALTVTVINPLLTVTQWTTTSAGTTGELTLPSETDYFIYRKEPYYLGAEDSIFLRSLEVGADYAIHLGPDNANPKWLNFTAETSYTDVRFVYDYEDQTSLQILVLDLYKDDALIESTFYTIITPTNQINSDFLGNFGSATAVLIAVVMITLVVLYLAFGSGRGKGKRRNLR